MSDVDPAFIRLINAAKRLLLVHGSRTAESDDLRVAVAEATQAVNLSGLPGLRRSTETEAATSPNDALRSRVLSRVHAWLDDVFAKSDARVAERVKDEITASASTMGVLTLMVHSPGTYNGKYGYQATGDGLPEVVFKEKGFLP